MDTRIRSLVKALSWRISGTIATSILVFLFTRQVKLSLEIGAAEFLSKVLIFYFHERVWFMITWGRKGAEPPPEKIPATVE